jgi:hypothetical protein
VGFLSASHDCTARLWTFGGETVLVFAGHAALVYAVAAMANGRGFFPTHHSKKRRSMSIPD